MDSTIYLTPDMYQEVLKKYYNLPSKAGGNLSLKQFFDLMFYVLQVEKPGINFAPAWPQYLIPSTPEYKRTMENPTKMFVDTITYMITREEPGSVGGSKQPFDSRRELTPKVREVSTVSNEKGKVTYGQWFDTLVQFDLWTLTNFEAEDFAMWFKRFMSTHRGFFRYMGLSEIHYWWRGRDEVSSSLNNNLHLRSMAFFVRTEEISYEEDYNLKELEIKLEQLKK